MKMKRFLASFLSVSMALSSVGVIAFAEGEETVTPAKAQGDLIWSEDFEGYENGADFSTNPSHDISLSNMSKETVSATINETDGNNKYCDCSCSYSGFGGFGLDCDFLRRKG